MVRGSNRLRMGKAEREKGKRLARWKVPLSQEMADPFRRGTASVNPFIPTFIRSNLKVATNHTTPQTFGREMPGVFRGKTTTVTIIWTIYPQGRGRHREPDALGDMAT
jgi:hypothetical protein